MRSWLCGGLLLLVACAEDETALSDEANVVAVDVANSARVEEDRLIFPASLISAELRAKIDAYDSDRWFWQGHEDTEVEQVLLVSDRANFVTAPDGSIDTTAGNPYGFIRRALSYKIKGNDIIISTERASLADVLQEQALHGTVNIASDYKKPAHDETVFIDKSGYELWKKGDEYIRFPSLWLNLKPEVDLDATFGVMKVKKAHLTVTADIEAELVVDARISELPEQALYRTIYEKTYKLDPIGIIPVSMSVRVDVGCEKSGGPVAIEGGLRTHSFLRGDVDYVRETGTKVTGQGTWEPQFKGKRFQVLSGDAAGLRCVAQPYLTVRLFDLPTGSLSVHADMDLWLTRPPDMLVARSAATAHLTGVLSSLGSDIADGNGKILDLNRTIWDGPAPVGP